MRSLRRSPAKHIDLLPQHQVFRLQRCSRLEARSQDTENQLEQIGHQDASLRRPLAASTRIEFSVYTAARANGNRPSNRNLTTTVVQPLANKSRCTKSGKKVQHVVVAPH